MESLCEYDFDVHYIKGKENVVADALSQRRHELSSMVTSTDLRGRILQHLPEDDFYRDVCQMIGSQRPLQGRFSNYVLESDGLLRHRGSIYVPSTGGLRDFIVLEAHRAPYATHPWVRKFHVELR